MQMFDSTVIRARMCRRPAARRQDGEALGRSRGGFSTKIHLKTDLDGYPIGFHLTGGEAKRPAATSKCSSTLGPDVDPRAVVADKGYDAKTNREAARSRGLLSGHPLSLEHHRQAEVLRKGPLYKARARIEQMMGKIKRFKRIALRCEKTARNYASFLALVCGFILIKSVHTA